MPNKLPRLNIAGWRHWLALVPALLVWLMITGTAQATPQLAVSLPGLDQPAARTGALPAFLPAAQAFAPTLTPDKQQIRVSFAIAPGYYLYRHKLQWQLSHGRLGAVELPAGQLHEDEFLGQSEVYADTLQFTLPVQAVSADSVLTLSWQGCTEGMCYPPQQTTLNWPADLLPTTATEVAATATPAESPAPAPDMASASASKPVPAAVPVAAADHAGRTTNARPDDPARLPASGLLSDSRHLWQTAGLFFLLGIGLSLTPCMLPMYPILSALLLGGGGLPLRRSLLLSLGYVQGMALTFTLFGLAVASAGAGLQAWLQQPLVLGLFSLLFIALALPMFGLFELQLPVALQTRLQQWAGRHRGGSLPGVIAMGAISALVCSPCTTAPLSAALLYVAQGGDRLQGALLLYLLACGMGLPLLLLGTLGPRWLPRRGLWMVRVRQLFGFVLLAAPLALLGRLLPAWGLALAWALWLVAVGGFVALRCLPAGRWRIVGSAIAPLLAILLGWWLWPGSQPALQFETVQDWPALQQRLQTARERGQPVMVDLYADWCSACHQFDQQTFRDPQVRQALDHWVRLRADVSAPDERSRLLLDALQVPGLPAILFFDGTRFFDGDSAPRQRVDGFLPADAFLQRLPATCHAGNAPAATC